MKKLLVMVLGLMVVASGIAKSAPTIRYLEQAIYEKLVEMGTPSGNTGQISFKNATNDNSAIIQSGVTSSTYTLTLPTALGTDGQVFAVDASGNMYFTDVATTTLTQEEVEDYVGAMVTGNTETLISVTYEDGDGTLDFVVSFTMTELENEVGYNIIVSTEIDTTAELEALSGDNIIIETEIDTIGELEVITSTDIITIDEIDSEVELEGVIGESIWTSGENIDPADVDATGDIKLNQDKKLILDDDAGSDSYVTSNSADNSVSFWLNGTEMFRLEP